MCLWSRRVVLPVLVLTAVVSTVSAHVVYLKDGYAVYGRVIREQELISDPATGQLVPIVKGGHTFLLNDGARFVVFGQKQVERADDKVDLRGDYVFFTMPFSRSPSRRRPAAAEIGEPKPFTPKWERQVPVTITIAVPQMQQPGSLIPMPAVVQDQLRKVSGSVRQRITLLTPYFIRLECVEYDWTQNYLTREFGPPVILPLLKVHPEVAGKPGEPPVFDRLFKVFRFCTQAGWLAEAQLELEALNREFPGERQKLDAAAGGLRQLRAQKLWEEADTSAKVGRFSRARELLAHIPVADLPAPLQADVANMTARLDDTAKKIDQARRLLGVVQSESGHVLSPAMADAAAVIGRELNFDTVPRLDAFITVARQREQEVSAGKEPKATAPAALALAVTAWVMGPAAAEASPEVAERLWTLRRGIQDYFRTTNAVDRKPMLDRLGQDSQLSVPEVARLIAMLPPPDGDVIAGAGTAAIDRQARNPHGLSAPTNYRLILPPEYHPNRAYPLLIVLPNVGESPSQAAAMWTEEANHRGYIVACPDWGGTGRAKYTFSPDEHAAVLDCLRDVRRVAQVDSDRVFLTGFGEGGNMAFDVGLSHPDQFAGVIPINGRPLWYASKLYWKNAQALPFYVVVGELTGKVRDWDSDICDKWAGRGYGSLLVLYRGRTLDYFPGEVSNALDWMERKRRVTAFPELGKNPNVGAGGEEYQTLRTTDNRFYWLSADQFYPKFTVANVADTKPEVAASFHAIIKDGNQVNVLTRGLKQITLWFGRSYDAHGNARDMVDFAKPIRIQVNAKPAWTNGGQPLTPSLSTMLEELHRCGDRQRLFFAKVEFSGL